MQEIGGVVEVITRVNEGLPHRILVRHGRNGRHLGDHADRGDFALLRIVDVGGVMVEGGHGPNDPGHDRHRMRITAETTIEIVHLLVHHGVARHQRLEFLHLRLGRQFAVKEQVADLKVTRLVRQLLDGIAAIQQLTLVAVDIGDGAVTRCRRRETRVIGEQTRLGIERSNIHHIRTHGSTQDREFVGLVSDDEFGDFFGH